MDETKRNFREAGTMEAEKKEKKSDSTKTDGKADRFGEIREMYRTWKFPPRYNHLLGYAEGVSKSGVYADHTHVHSQYQGGVAEFIQSCK